MTGRGCIGVAKESLATVHCYARSFGGFPHKTNRPERRRGAPSDRNETVPFVASSRCQGELPCYGVTKIPNGPFQFNVPPITKMNHLIAVIDAPAKRAEGAAAVEVS